MVANRLKCWLPGIRDPLGADADGPFGHKRAPLKTGQVGILRQERGKPFMGGTAQNSGRATREG